METKEADENGEAFGRAVMDGGDGNPGSFFRLVSKGELRRNQTPGDVPGEEGAGEGGSAAVPPPAWRRRATMVVAVAGERTERRSGEEMMAKCSVSEHLMYGGLQK